MEWSGRTAKSHSEREIYSNSLHLAAVPAMQPKKSKSKLEGDQRVHISAKKVTVEESAAKFLSKIAEGPVYACCCCHRLHSHC